VAEVSADVVAAPCAASMFSRGDSNRATPCDHLSLKVCLHFPAKVWLNARRPISAKAIGAYEGLSIASCPRSRTNPSFPHAFSRRSLTGHGSHVGEISERIVGTTIAPSPGLARQHPVERVIAIRGSEIAAQAVYVLNQIAVVGRLLTPCNPQTPNVRSGTIFGLQPAKTRP
jgi:hypothetical protein